MADFIIADHGSIVLVTPTNDEAKGWLKHHVDTEETQYFGGALVVEPRYLGDLIDGFHQWGFDWAF